MRFLVSSLCCLVACEMSNADLWVVGFMKSTARLVKRSTRAANFASFSLEDRLSLWRFNEGESRSTRIFWR